MSGGGSSNPLSQIGNTISKGVQAIGNYYGFDNSGKWTNQGGAFHAIDEGIGEITGRNQSRAALNFAQSQYQAAQTQANNLVAQQQWNQQQNDIAGSQTAQATRATTIATSGINYSNSTPMVMGAGASPGNKDFLGL